MRTKISKDKRNKSSPWIVRWSNGPDAITGKEKWFQKSFKYKAQAEKFKAKLKVGVAKETQYKLSGDVTLAEFRKLWLETSGQLKASTIDLYHDLSIGSKNISVPISPFKMYHLNRLRSLSIFRRTAVKDLRRRKSYLMLLVIKLSGIADHCLTRLLNGNM